MRQITAWSLALIGLLLFSGCAAASPPSRLHRYVAVTESGADDSPRLPASRPVRTALVLLIDRSDPDSAPALPDEAQAKVAETLSAHINRGFPLTVERIVTLGEWPASGMAPDWNALATQQGVDYLVVTVLSSVEQEYPASLFLGWTSHRQPGLRRDNWSLAEAALVDRGSGRQLMYAEGRAMATLDRPTVPGISQWYPVIYLRPQEPERRLWPPTYEGAPVTLRVVAMEQAAIRLAGNLQRAWIEQRERESLGNEAAMP
ncbi:MAG: hypothetical protein JSR62_14870 [Nitrospira sp.]|nr:hypothetical protein [Nitrospira sp.]